MRRAWRICAWVLGPVLALTLSLLAVVLIAGNTAGGRGVIERSIARFSDGHVRLAGLTGTFPAAIDLVHLQLSDARGVWLSADHISLRWSPLALVARHLKVEHLQIARLAIERRPVSRASQKSGTGVPHVDIGQLSTAPLRPGPRL